MGVRVNNSFKLKRPKIGIIFGIIYFLVAAGLTTYFFVPKPVDASSDERLFIPSIGLVARVENIERQGNTLKSPDYIAGAYFATAHKTVIIGHSSTIFKDLHNIKISDKFNFDNKSYIVKKIEILEKSVIDMNEIVSETEENTLVLMTCYGESLGGQDFSHRFIVTAKEV
ncbi:sortase [Candidatus Saccharibacteria bacterium]|nr:sortase [Candidatus Saccharibacteria bacterium]